MMNMQMPVLRIELEGLKQATYHAMVGASDEINAELERQLEAHLTPENIGGLIAGAIRDVVPKAINGAVEKYFRYGDGRVQLEESITAMLSGEGKQ